MARKLRKLILFSLVSLLLNSCGGEYGRFEPYESHPAMARQNANLGLFYLHQGYTNLAQEKLQLALDQAPNDPLILDAMGYYLEKIGDIHQANSYFTAAYIAAPDSGTIKNNYGAFLCRNGYYNLAVPHFVKAAQLQNYAQTQKALANARYCHELMKTQLGDRAEYDYYKHLLWSPQSKWPQAH